MARTRSFKERVGALKNLRPFIAMVWNTSPHLAAASLVLRLVRALLPVATLFVGKLIIDEVVRLAAAGHAQESLREWLASGLVDRLLILLGIELGLAVVSDVLGRVVSLMDALLSERFSNTTSIRLMEHAASLDLEDFEDSELQDRLDRARRQTMGRTALMSQLFGQAQDVITIASFAASLIVYAPWLIVLLVVALVPAFIGEAHFNAQSYSLNYAWTPERRELDYVRQTGASVETAKEVKIFGLNAFLIERYRMLSEAFYTANRTLAARRATWGGLLTAIGTVGYYVAYAFIAWRTLRGDFTIGDLTFLSGSFRRLRNLLEGLLIGFSQVAGQALYLDDLFSFFEIRPEIVSPPNPRPVPVPIRDGFTFEDVGFRYEGAERWAVRHLSFTLRAGEVLALVGENGAGKTTLVKLLARLYDPDEGRILLDGHDLREYDLAELRANIGVIFQDFVRYHLTAAENIMLTLHVRGVVGDHTRQAAAALDAVGLTRRAKAFPGQMSGGEKQRVAIARALAGSPSVILADEPTAALDGENGKGVMELLADVAQDRSRAVLAVTHDHRTVTYADRVIQIEDGEIVGSQVGVVRHGVMPPGLRVSS